MVNSIERRREIMGQRREGCKLSLLKLRMFTNVHWIDVTVVTMETFHLHWKNVNIYLNSGAGLEVD